MPDPIWRRIAEDLRQKIESGELGRDGRALPSELELRDQYEASRNTVRDAVKWLTTRGLVETRPGQGTFVVKAIDPFVAPLDMTLEAVAGSETGAYLFGVTERLRKSTVSIPRIEIQQAHGLVASELEVPSNASVVSRHQQRYIDDTPWSLQTSFYPMRYVERGATLIIQAAEIKPGVVPYIEKTLGIKQAGWRERFAVRAPDRRETEFFALPDDGRIAVIETIRTGYEESGEPLRLTVTTYPADRNQFVRSVGKVPDPFGDAPSTSSS
jgi:GntR family transcriptional regulator